MTDTLPIQNTKLAEHGLVSYTAAKIEADTGLTTVFSGGMPCNVPSTKHGLFVSGTYEHPGTHARNEVRIRIASGTPAQLEKFARQHAINLTA